ncbi:L-aspartate oxidase [Tichowtungia aerotolerans]|uniref:L-aspartate oxidase n=1 Tax=Tichowtungia aerotolerans TaxID=2697043 RepID=A0A6P1M064_9BACT|nr:L-aspartate oxidase [Tichowtungia aerotolerans]QHI68189.1 L-aspartate oxidase [Tichowtungia aerotolerans]
MQIRDTDFLIIGSGLAGLTAALELSRHGKVLVVSKQEAAEGNTRYAQGGISCVVDPDDSMAQHIADTLETGNGLSEEAAVRAIVEGGPARIAQLEAAGVHFEHRSDKPEEYDLGQEGGHSRRRVLHAGDVTGGEVIKRLLERVRADANITLVENWLAIDVVPTGWIGLAGPNRCVGCYFLDKTTSEILAVRAPATILATGGLGKVYLYTSNPDVATGDGIAMAWRAGLPLRDMEMIQFHPTCLYHPDAKSFLISEAVRGEGARLIDRRGREFVYDFDPRGALAPRDVTARAIDSVMKKYGDPFVYLDISHRDADFLQKRFPTLYKTCLQFGFDMALAPVPVVPAAHYSCGGVVADVDGSTAMPGLYAIGEVASTGLHGANRLASNSLLEATVCGCRCAEKISKVWKNNSVDGVEIPRWECGDAVSSEEAVVVEHDWNEVRSVMWDYVGIVRSDRLLRRARRRIHTIREEIRSYYREYLVTADLIELRNLAAVAELIVRSAQCRKESRGLHYNRDWPEKNTVADHSIIQDKPGGPLNLE